ncbi:MAG: glycoside hydrolase family 5 protein [Notoacmeibacter sp.]
MAPLAIQRIGLWVALALVSTSAIAAPPVFKRGVAMELWTSWPAETEWSKPEVLFPFPEWRRNVTPEALKALKTSGLDFVRLPIDPGVFLSEQTKDLHEKLLTEIETTVSDIKNAGLNVIVDLHTIPGGNASRPGAIEGVLANNEAFGAYTDLAVLFAKRFAADKNIALELINEPVIDCENATPKRWPAMIGRLHKAARAAAPDLPLVITGGCWGDAEMLKDLPKSVTKDKNAIFSFHSYAPFLLTHQGATWAGDFIPLVNGLPFPPSRFGETDLKTALNGVEANIRAKAPAHRIDGMIAYLGEEIARIDTDKKLKATLEKPFISAAKFAKAHKIPAERMLLGEFGMINQEWGNPMKMPVDWRVDYMKTVRKLAEAKGFGWSIWSYSGAFGIVQGFGGEPVNTQIIERVLSE